MDNATIIYTATPPTHSEHTRELRSMFWQNVVQQMLTSFPERVQQDPEIADGRLSVLTRGGDRIPIRAVVPLFSLSVPVDPELRALSVAVQCSVFEIHTPHGEVVTLPLEEIRGVHSLSEQLVAQLKEMTQEMAGDETEPFGFAAFTSMAKQQRDDEAARAART